MPDQLPHAADFRDDARDDYFSRRIEGGRFWLDWIDKSGTEHKVSVIGPKLRRGAATVMVTLPDKIEVGDTARLIARTKDTRSEFQNQIEVNIKPAAEHREGGKADQRERKLASKNPGKIAKSRGNSPLQR